MKTKLIILLFLVTGCAWFDFDDFIAVSSTPDSKIVPVIICAGTSNMKNLFNHPAFSSMMQEIRDYHGWPRLDSIVVYHNNATVWQHQDRSDFSIYSDSSEIWNKIERKFEVLKNRLAENENKIPEIRYIITIAGGGDVQTGIAQHYYKAITDFDGRVRALGSSPYAIHITQRVRDDFANGQFPEHLAYQQQAVDSLAAQYPVFWRVYDPSPIPAADHKHSDDQEAVKDLIIEQIKK